MHALLWLYLILYPLLQVWILVRCRGGWRTAAVLGLVPLAPFYLWCLGKLFGSQASGDLSGMLIEFAAPWALLYPAVIAIGDSVSRAAGAAVPVAATEGNPSSGGRDGGAKFDE